MPKWSAPGPGPTERNRKSSVCEQEEQVLGTSTMPALPALLLPSSALVSVSCWEGPKGRSLLSHHSQSRTGPLPPWESCSRWLCSPSCLDSSGPCTCPQKGKRLQRKLLPLPHMEESTVCQQEEAVLEDPALTSEGTGSQSGAWACAHPCLPLMPSSVLGASTPEA